MKKVNILKPCQYGWDKMVASGDKGRLCLACDKVVVDFTRMTTDQILTFLEATKENRVCGHFKTIDTARNTTWYQKPFLKLYNIVDNNYKM